MQRICYHICLGPCKVPGRKLKRTENPDVSTGSGLRHPCRLECSTRKQNPPPWLALLTGTAWQGGLGRGLRPDHWEELSLQVKAGESAKATRRRPQCIVEAPRLGGGGGNAPRRELPLRPGGATCAAASGPKAAPRGPRVAMAAGGGAARQRARGAAAGKRCASACTNWQGGRSPDRLSVAEVAHPERRHTHGEAPGRGESADRRSSTGGSPGTRVHTRRGRAPAGD